MLDTFDKQLTQIEWMVLDIEMSQLNQNVLEKLREGNEALQTLNSAFSIEDVEKIMEDTQEAAEYQEEISNLLSGKLTDSDLADVEHEFDEMFHIELPEAPDDELVATKEAGRIPVKQEKSKRVAVAAS